MHEGPPETVPLAGMHINIMLIQCKRHARPKGANTAKPSSNQLGRGVEREGKSNAHPQPQPGNGPHGNKSRTKPSEDHLIEEGHHIGQHHQTCSIGLRDIITATANVLDDELMYENRQGEERDRLGATRTYERNFFKSGHCED